MFKIILAIFNVILVFRSACHGAKLPPRHRANVRENVELESFIYEPNDLFQSDDPHTVTDAPIEDESNIVPTVTGETLNLETNVQQPSVQEPVQHYVNPYGGPYLPQGYNYPGIVLTPQWAQYLSHPQVAYSPVHTEYEGFLIPVQSQPTMPPKSSTHPPQQQTDYLISDRPSKSPIPELSLILRNLLPIMINWGATILNAFSVVAFGGLITTAICSLTPLCSITFGAIPFAALKKFANNIDNGSTTIERVRRAAQSLRSAIEKYAPSE